MKKFLVTILFLFAIFCNGQISKLRITINESNFEDSTCYKMYIFYQLDTIYNEFINAPYENEFDSLTPSYYKIHLYNCSDLSEPVISKNCTLFADKITKVNLDISFVETHSSFNKKTREEIVTDRAEVQLSLSYFQTNWVDKNSQIKFGASIGFTAYKWFAFSKHIGILTGWGLGLSHYSISKDTSFVKFNQLNKTYEYYNYFDIHGDFKVRFTIGNQQVAHNLTPKGILDIGALYNAPIIFKEIARYENNAKVTNSFLHHYTDARAYINVGFAPLLFFFEYRLSDFIIGNYPELSRYNAGIRLIVN